MIAPPERIPWFLLLVAAYVLTPGHPDVGFAGIPVGQSGIAVLVVLGLLHGVGAPRLSSRTLVFMLALIGVKAMLGALAPERGWLGHYYANATFTPPHERSIDYRDLAATRIDRQLAFSDTSFPVHFFNDSRFNRGFRREYTEPFSVRWTAEALVDEHDESTPSLRVRGEAAVFIDEEERARVNSTESVVDQGIDIPLQPGWHAITIEYSKPANVEGVLTFEGLRSVWPERPADWQVAAAAPLRVVAVFAHFGVLVLLLHAFGTPVRDWARHTRISWNSDRVRAALDTLEPLVIIGLTLQGLWKTRHRVGHVWTLTGGDDWMTFEYNARDVVLNGILMTDGTPLGEGSAFFAYPGYIYFTAAVHALAGESLANVLLANFVVLAIATMLIARLARLLVPASAALLAVIWLLLLQQADFVRYYTVTLLSENLYFATIAAMVLSLTRYVMLRSKHQAIAAGFWGGVSAVTRPAAMLWMPFALAVAFLAPQQHEMRRRLTGAFLVLALWMAAIIPFTVRNYIVSGEPVLISAGQAKSFIDFNMPPENPELYLKMFDGSLLSAARVLLQMLIDQPAAFLRATVLKMGFSIGMTHWANGVGRHPELLLTSLLYVVAIALVPASRSLRALPLHTFVLTHLVVVTLSLPWNYGYRMILPMYPFMTIFAMAVPIVMLEWLKIRRSAMPTPASAPLRPPRE